MTRKHEAWKSSSGKLLFLTSRATATATFKSKRATSHVFVKVHYVEVSTSGILRSEGSIWYIKDIKLEKVLAGRDRALG
jgi:hypothetical protein